MFKEYIIKRCSCQRFGVALSILVLMLYKTSLKTNSVCKVARASLQWVGKRCSPYHPTTDSRPRLVACECEYSSKKVLYELKLKITNVNKPCLSLLQFEAVKKYYNYLFYFIFYPSIFILHYRIL